MSRVDNEVLMWERGVVLWKENVSLRERLRWLRRRRRPADVMESSVSGVMSAVDELNLKFHEEKKRKK